jgi:REP element-mobilizing transposase RayT
MSGQIRLLVVAESARYIRATGWNETPTTTTTNHEDPAMSHSYCRLLNHIVYSTKQREPWLKALIASDVHRYLAGIVRNEGGTPIIVNGDIDHVHLLVGLHQDMSVSTLLRVLKSKSSGWIHRTYPQLREFAWQEGYGAFSVTGSDSERVRKYILGQEEHHRRISFQDEFIALLEEHGVNMIHGTCGCESWYAARTRLGSSPRRGRSDYSPG